MHGASMSDADAAARSRVILDTHFAPRPTLTPRCLIILSVLEGMAITMRQGFAAVVPVQIKKLLHGPGSQVARQVGVRESRGVQVPPIALVGLCT